MDLITTSPELQAALSQTMALLLKQYGLLGLLVILVLLFAAGVVFKKIVDVTLKAKLEELRFDLNKLTTKDVEIWKQQKELMFEFVEFLEERLFNNPKIHVNTEEKQEAFKKLNSFYGRLYLVMDTSILEKINELLNNTVSNVQRYYLYRELREQLLRIIMNDFNKEKDCPYISDKSTALPKIAGQIKDSQPTNFEEAKRIYPFLERYKPDSEDYKSIPWFNS